MSGVFQLLIGYESGLVVLWDLRTKTADSRFQGAEPLRSVSWLSDGKQLMTAHADGSTWTWNSRAGPKPAPVAVTYPHGWLSHPTLPYPPAPFSSPSCYFITVSLSKRPLDSATIGRPSPPMGISEGGRGEWEFLQFWQFLQLHFIELFDG